MMTDRIGHKIKLCLRNARECRRASWQEPKEHRRIYLQLSRQAMQDARYWIDERKELQAMF